MKKYSRDLNIKQSTQKFKESILSAVTEIDVDNPTDQQILRIAISAELSAINLYQSLANRAALLSVVKKVLLDVAKEEKTHVAEFETLLNEIDSEQSRENIKGEIEIEDMREEKIKKAELNRGYMPTKSKHSVKGAKATYWRCPYCRTKNWEIDEPYNEIRKCMGCRKDSLLVQYK